MDVLSELASSFTPYRYGFNNPVFWQDATGLFESYGAAQSWIDKWGLTGTGIFYNRDKGVYEISGDGYSAAWFQNWIHEKFLIMAHIITIMKEM